MQGAADTYDKGLVEREHDDELDGQELGERPASRQLVLRKAIEDEQPVQRDANSICKCLSESICLSRYMKNVRDADEIDDAEIGVRRLEAPRARLTEDTILLADDASDRQRCKVA